MHHQTIHKNLDTSFVNLSALIKYLRRRQFTGSVKVQLNGYKADVEFGADSSLRVHEHDEISGRIADGEEALQRLLIRARESGGTINVYQAFDQKPVETPDAIKSKVDIPAQNNAPKATKSIPVKVANGRPSAPPVAPNSRVETPVKKPLSKPKVPQQQQQETNGFVETSENTSGVGSSHPSLPDFPFELTNKFEAKARNSAVTAADWQTVLKSAVELLTVVDRSLAVANLNFSAEFRKVCIDVAGDYPFLNPSAEIFEYSRGKISMEKQMNPKMFIGGISETLRKILLKLSKSQKYSEIYNVTSNRLQILMKKRDSVYRRFGVENQIRRIVSP